MKEYSHALSLLELPFYAFDLKNFWMSYSRSFGSNKSLEFKVPVIQYQIYLYYLQFFKPFSTGLNYLKMEYLLLSHLTYRSQCSSLDGIALCPASVFCDMAFAAAKGLIEGSNQEENILSTVLKDLEITHPLVASSKVFSNRSLK